MPRLEELQTYCAVVEQKSFSRAAELLGLTQPAVSLQVKSLEAEYGVTLLHREGFEILPTEHGRAVYAAACEIIKIYRQSRQQVQSASAELSGRLLVGASTGPGEFLVPLLLGSFKNTYPHVVVSLRVADSHDIIEAVFNRSIEIGFAGTQRRDRHLAFEPYLQDELVLVVGAGHTLAHRELISFDDLLEIPLILQQQGSGATTVLQEALRVQGIQLNQLNVVMELGLQESTKAAVKAGFGATIISRLGVNEELERGTLVQVPVDGLELSRDIYLCYYRSAPLSNLAQTFIEFTWRYKDSLFAGGQGRSLQ